MKKPKKEDFKREVYDGQDFADWYADYYTALEIYISFLESELSKKYALIAQLKNKITETFNTIK